MAGRGYYPLGAYDAHRLALMIGQLSDSRTRVKRADMALYCWSRMVRSGSPCPNFTVGIRTVAQECGVSEMAARGFLERAEGAGWLVRVGTVRRRWPGGGGEYVKRTFLWVAEEAADQSGMGLDEWLESVGVCSQNNTPYPRETTHPLEKAQQNSTRGSVESPCGNNTHQSTEYSESSALHSLTECESAALPGPVDYGVDLTPEWMGGGDA